MGWWRRRTASVPASVVTELRGAALAPADDPVVSVARRGRTLPNGLVIVFDRYEQGGTPVEHLAVSHASGRRPTPDERRGVCLTFWPDGRWEPVDPRRRPDLPGSFHYARPAATETLAPSPGVLVRARPNGA